MPLKEGFWESFERDGHRVFGHPFDKTYRIDEEYVKCDCGDKIYCPMYLFNETNYKYGGMI